MNGFFRYCPSCGVKNEGTPGEMQWTCVGCNSTWSRPVLVDPVDGHRVVEMVERIEKQIEPMTDTMKMTVLSVLATNVVRDVANRLHLSEQGLLAMLQLRCSTALSSTDDADAASDDPSQPSRTAPTKPPPRPH